VIAGANPSFAHAKTDFNFWKLSPAALPGTERREARKEEKSVEGFDGRIQRGCAG